MTGSVDTQILLAAKTLGTSACAQTGALMLMLVANEPPGGISTA